MNSPAETQTLGDRVAHLAVQMTTGEHAFITAIGAFEESGQWIQEGAMTCAQWLSWRIGMSPEAGRERLRVAKALKELAKVDEAFRTAHISYSKVRAVTRVATTANEELLLEIARGSTAAQLERICRKFRGCMQGARPQAAEERRRLSVRHGDNGTVRIAMELPADEGCRVLAAIESGRAALEEQNEGDVSAVRPGRVDGFMAVVESWFASGAQPRRGGAPHEVVLHVSAETLAGSSGNSGDVSEGTGSGQVGPLSFVDTAGGVGVSDETARRICCDASISAVVQGAHGEVLDVGRKSRTVPAAIARALEAREGRVCSFPGCSHTLFLDKHHIQHWANGGATSLENLCQLCRHHHTFVHEFGWRIEKVAGVVRFFEPNGRQVCSAPELPALGKGSLLALADAQRVEVDELSLTADSCGEPVDYVQVIDALLHETLVAQDAERRADKCVSAEIQAAEWASIDTLGDVV